MTWFHVYDLHDDPIERPGLSESPARVGSTEWWGLLGTGAIHTRITEGVIEDVFLGSMLDFPTFTLRTAAGECRSFTRERTVPSGDGSVEPYYTTGRRVRVEEAAVELRNKALSAALPSWITTRLAIDRDTPSGDDVTLYRPVGREELLLIMESRLRRFPPRLADQPIFYPVLDEPYAVQIARDWNARDASFGYVTRFRIPRSCFASFEVHTVGGRQHRELWIPAEELDAFNERIVGSIEVLTAYHPSPNARR
jgi:hypothetical protein